MKNPPSVCDIWCRLFSFSTFIGLSESWYKRTHFNALKRVAYDTIVFSNYYFTLQSTHYTNYSKVDIFREHINCRCTVIVIVRTDHFHKVFHVCTGEKVVNWQLLGSWLSGTRCKSCNNLISENMFFDYKKKKRKGLTQFEEYLLLNSFPTTHTMERISNWNADSIYVSSFSYTHRTLRYVNTGAWISCNL